MRSISKLVEACEISWNNIRKLNPEVGEAVIVVGSGGRKAGRLYGHFIPNKWQVEVDERTIQVHEVLICAENLNREARDVFTTILHESVHALAFSRGIKDVSGQRHNRRFATLCKEVGLVPPETADSSLGYSHATLSRAYMYDYAVDIQRIDRALKMCRLMPPEKQSNASSWKAKCPCDRTLKVGKKTIEEGPLVCGMCEETFTLYSD